MSDEIVAPRGGEKVVTFLLFHRLSLDAMRHILVEPGT